MYAGYIGGSGLDYGLGIAVDSLGNAYLTGRAESTEATFPVTVGPDLTYNGGTGNAFVAKITEISPGPTVTSVSSASFLGPVLAPDSIASAFGDGLATATASASSTPLPTTLAGSTLRITDSVGVERSAGLFFVSPRQINFLVPPQTARGLARVFVTNAGGSSISGTMVIEPIAPGVFSANASGRDVAAATALRVRADGSQVSEPVFRLEAGKFVSVPIDPGPESDQLFLILYSTGIRSRSALSAVTARIGSENAEVMYAGPQGDFVGLDQINVRVPRAPAGAAEVNVVLTVDGRPANTVTVNIGRRQ